MPQIRRRTRMRERKKGRRLKGGGTGKEAQRGKKGSILLGKNTTLVKKRVVDFNG
jgi:hypothetical protein